MTVFEPPMGSPMVSHNAVHGAHSRAKHQRERTSGFCGGTPLQKSTRLGGGDSIMFRGLSGKVRSGAGGGDETA